ncbi:MAG TPA: multiubiquitin domain-containing protein [Hanamia sp.]|nr:multiubiquitin domain-containing protein [Hanamia sp.]
MENLKSDQEHPGKKELQFSINETEYKWEKQYITGREIRLLGNIPVDADIFLRIKKPWTDEEIEDGTRVDLARPERENFYSKPKAKEVFIIVKGKSCKWDLPQICFADVIKLAFGQYVDSPTMIYTVGYEDGPKENREGTMVKGECVFVKNKMIFHATATDKS